MKHDIHVITCTNKTIGEGKKKKKLHLKFRRSTRGIFKNAKCCPACGDPLLDAKKERLTKGHHRRNYTGLQSRRDFLGLSTVYMYR